LLEQRGEWTFAFAFKCHKEVMIPQEPHDRGHETT
jgi:hypothetical protein